MDPESAKASENSTVMNSYTIGPFIVSQQGVATLTVYYEADGHTHRCIVTVPGPVTPAEVLSGRKIMVDGDNHHYSSVLDIAEHLGLKSCDIQGKNQYHAVLGYMALEFLYISGNDGTGHVAHKTVTSVERISESGAYAFDIKMSGVSQVKPVIINTETDIAFWVAATGMVGKNNSDFNIVLTKVQDRGAMKTVQGRLESVREYLSDLIVLAYRKDGFNDMKDAALRLWVARLSKNENMSNIREYRLEFADNTSVWLSSRAWNDMIAQLFGILLLWREDLLKEIDAPVAIAEPESVSIIVPVAAAEVVPEPVAEVVAADDISDPLPHPKAVGATIADRWYDSYSKSVHELFDALRARNVEIRLPPYGDSAQDIITCLMKLGIPRIRSLGSALNEIYGIRIAMLRSGESQSNLIDYYVLIDSVFGELETADVIPANELYIALREVETLLDLEGIVPANLSLMPVMVKIYLQRINSLDKQ